MPKSIPMLDPNVAPAPGDMLYTVKDTGLPDRDQRSTLMEVLQAYLSGDFTDLGLLAWDKGQPITNVPAWRSQYPSGDLEQGWLNLRDVLDPVSNVDLSWNITTENPVVALESYTQSLRVAVSGNSASARTFTLTGTPRAGQEIWFFVGTANLTTPALIKHGTDTMATVRGGELVRVYTSGTALFAQVVGGPQNLVRASDLTWLTGPLLESWFEGLGWADEDTPGWTGDQLKTVLDAQGPTYQEAASAGAAARRLSEELSGPFNLEVQWGNTGVTDEPSDDTVFAGTPCRAVRVRGHAVDATSPTTDATLSLEMGLTAGYLNDDLVILGISGILASNAPMFAFLSAVTHLTPGAHVLEVPCIFSRPGKRVAGMAFISIVSAGPTAITGQISFSLDLAEGDGLTWNMLRTEFPSGGVKLSLHANFTIPAPPAA